MAINDSGFDDSSPAGDGENKKSRSGKARAVKKPPKKVTETWLHNSGLHYLQRFAASTGRFRQVMMRKIDKSCRHHPDQDREECVRMLDALIEKFCRAGLLDDEVYARGAIASLTRRGLSLRGIENKLKEKGLGAGQIKDSMELLNEARDENDLKNAVRFARRKRVGPFGKSEADPELKQKQMAILGRAGFGYQTVQKVLAMDIETAEAFIEDLS